MEAVIALPEAAGRTIAGWRVDEGRLVVTVDGTARFLRCVCARSHWIVETGARDGRTVLAVRCHGCGRRGEFLVAAVPA